MTGRCASAAGTPNRQITRKTQGPSHTESDSNPGHRPPHHDCHTPTGANASSMYRDSTQLHLQGINFHGDSQSNNTNRCLEYLTRSRAISWPRRGTPYECCSAWPTPLRFEQQCSAARREQLASGTRERPSKPIWSGSQSGNQYQSSNNYTRSEAISEF